MSAIYVHWTWTCSVMHCVRHIRRVHSSMHIAQPNTARNDSTGRFRSQSRLKSENSNSWNTYWHWSGVRMANRTSNNEFKRRLLATLQLYIYIEPKSLLVSENIFRKPIWINLFFVNVHHVCAGILDQSRTTFWPHNTSRIHNYTHITCQAPASMFIFRFGLAEWILNFKTKA